MFLTLKEKEKYVLKMYEEGRTYKEIITELHVSPRDISKIIKKANGEKEAKERKKIVLSKTAQALKLFKTGKSPTEVAIKLDLSPEETQSLYVKYLSLNNLHHFVEMFKEFDNDSLQDFIDYYDFMKENEITKEQLVETIKMNNDLPNIREEYREISDQLPELQKEREFYISDNKLLISKNSELNNECNLLLSKIESANRMLELTEDELNKKRELVDTITDSEKYVTLKNRIEEQVNDFLNQKKEFFKLTVMTILNIIKEDPEKEALIKNILYPNENPNSGLYLISYEEKITNITIDTLSDIALEINTNNILN